MTKVIKRGLPRVTEYSLGTFTSDYPEGPIYLDNKKIEWHKYDVKGGIFVPTFTEKELNFYSRPTNKFQEAWFNMHNRGSHVSGISNVLELVHGQEGFTEYCSKLRKNKNQIDLYNFFTETSFLRQRPIINPSRIGFFESSEGYESRLDDADKRQEEIDKIFGAKEKRHREKLRTSMDIIRSVSSISDLFIYTMERLGLNIKNVEKYKENIEDSICFMNFSSGSAKTITLEGGFRVHIGNDDFQPLARAKISFSELSSSKLEELLISNGKITSAGVDVANFLGKSR